MLQPKKTPQELPVYCADCGVHMSGPEVPGGKRAPGVSHGLCPACMQKFADQYFALTGKRIDPSQAFQEGVMEEARASGTISFKEFICEKLYEKSVE